MGVGGGDKRSRSKEENISQIENLHKTAVDFLPCFINQLVS